MIFDGSIDGRLDLVKGGVRDSPLGDARPIAIGLYAAAVVEQPETAEQGVVSPRVRIVVHYDTQGHTLTPPLRKYRPDQKVAVFPLRCCIYLLRLYLVQYPIPTDDKHTDTDSAV